MLIVAAAVLGLLIGSFLNVVVHRVPLGLSVVSPPSRCPGCGVRVRARDNVPVVSWALLRGRCRDCAMPISHRYPLVEIGTGLAFALVAARIDLDWVLPAYLYLAAVGVALALIDVDTHRLPNVLTLPSYVVAGVLLGAAALLGSDSGSLLRAAEGGAAMYAFYFALVLAYPKGMGFGDVKLAGVLGLYTGWLGWGVWTVGLFGGFLLGALWGLGVVASGRGDRKSKVPFGPFMLLGVLVALLVGAPLTHAYVGITLGG